MKAKFDYAIFKIAFIRGLMIGVFIWNLSLWVNPKYIFDNSEIPEMFQGPAGAETAVLMMIGFFMFFASCTWDYLPIAHKATRMKFLNNLASSVGAVIPLLFLLLKIHLN